MKPLAAWSVLAVLGVGILGASSAPAADGPLETVEKINVRAVAHFDFNRATLRAEDQPKILAEVAQMKDVTWQTITTVGYTDAVGDPGYNERLAARRARAVKGFLTRKGLDPQMIRTEAKGEEAPVADNETEEGRAQNRRTEIVFEGVRTASR